MAEDAANICRSLGDRLDPLAPKSLVPPPGLGRQMHSRPVLRLLLRVDSAHGAAGLCAARRH